MASPAANAGSASTFTQASNALLPQSIGGNLANNNPMMPWLMPMGVEARLAADRLGASSTPTDSSVNRSFSPTGSASASNTIPSNQVRQRPSKTLLGQ